MLSTFSPWVNSLFLNFASKYYDVDSTGKLKIGYRLTVNFQCIPRPVDILKWTQPDKNDLGNVAQAFAQAFCPSILPKQFPKWFRFQNRSRDSLVKIRFFMGRMDIGGLINSVVWEMKKARRQLCRLALDY